MTDKQTYPKRLFIFRTNCRMTLLGCPNQAQPPRASPFLLHSTLPPPRKATWASANKLHSSMSSFGGVVCLETFNCCQIFHNSSDSMTCTPPPHEVTILKLGSWTLTDPGDSSLPPSWRAAPVPINHTENNPSSNESKKVRHCSPETKGLAGVRRWG